MKINDIFFSIQGEGINSGLPTIFIRLTGCNLRCKYCDTKYAYSEGNEFSIKDIKRIIEKYPCKRICLTGGEPLLQDYRVLLKLLSDYEISIETNGSKDISKALKYASIVLDIKCPSSSEEKKNLYSNLNLIRLKDQVKFVIGSFDDIQFALDIINKYKLNNKTNILFSPVYGFDPKVLVDKIKNTGLNIRLSLQIHKIIWPEEMRGV